MSTPQPNTLPTVPLGMLQSMTEAICDRPGDSAAQCASRRLVVTNMAQDFQPRDAVEMMLVGMVIAHAHLLEDAVHDVYHGPDDRVTPRTRSAIVALDRGMFGFLRELRAAQARWRKAEVMANKAAGAVAPEGIADKAEPEKTPASRAKPVIREAPNNPPARAPVLEPSKSGLQPLRGTEASVAAMTAVLVPAMPPFVTSAALGRRENVPSPVIGEQLKGKAAAENVRDRAA